MIETCPGTSWNHDSIGENRGVKLDNGTVHLWHANVDVSSGQFAKYLSLLSVDEAERAAKYHFEKDRKQFVVSRGILRCLIGQYQNVRPEEVVFCFSEFGKPELAGEVKSNDEPFHFNIGHSGGHVLLGFSAVGELGVDLEFLRLRENRMVPLISRICSENEKEWVKVLPAAKREIALSRLWTAKEAYLKSIGTGFQVSPEQIEIHPSVLYGDSYSGKVIHMNQSPGVYLPQLIYPIPSAEAVLGCSAALAVSESSGLATCRWMSSVSGK